MLWLENFFVSQYIGQSQITLVAEDGMSRYLVFELRLRIARFCTKMVLLALSVVSAAG